MRILYISNHLPRPHEPGAQRPWRLLEFLRKQGHQISVVTNQRHYMTDRRLPGTSQPFHLSCEKGVPILSVASTAGKQRNMALRIQYYMFTSVMTFFGSARFPRVDLIYVRTPPVLINASAWAASRIRRVPWVLEIGDLHPASARELGLVRNRVLLGIWERWEAFFRRQADLIIAVVPGIVSLLEERGTSCDRVLVAPNGWAPIPPEQEEEPPARHRAVFRALAGKHIVTYTGTMGRARPLETALEAAHLLQDKAPGVHFVFVGDGDRKKSLETTCCTFGLRNCTFLDPVSQNSIPWILGRSDVLFHVLPQGKLHEYSLPNKIFNYVGSGRPVLLCGEGESARLICSAGCGLVVAPEDGAAFARAIRHLCNSPDKRREMGKRGISYARKHLCPEKSFRRIDGELRRLVEPRRRGTHCRPVVLNPPPRKAFRTVISRTRTSNQSDWFSK